MTSWSSGLSRFRHTLLQVLVSAGIAVAWLTEFLSLFHWVTFTGLMLGWTALCAAALAVVRKKGLPRFSVAWPVIADALPIAAIVTVVSIIGFIAAVSPPNSVDVLMYHMPRVVFWKQAGSVAFFPTQYLNQIMQPPLAEYAMLHTYVLSGGDRFANLVTVVGFLGGIVAVSLIAKEFGAARRGEIIAAVFCATLPNGILQASGTKNECLLALWLAAAAYFALRSNYV